MKLGIRDIKGFVGKSKSFTLENAVPHIKLGRDTFPFAAPIQAIGSVINEGDRIYKVDSIVKATVKKPCYRCLSMTKVDLSINFDRLFSDLAKNEDIIRFTGDYIELLPEILNEIALNMPGQILCAAECQGLCMYCGCNLNFVKCQCDIDTVDPRLEIFKKLLK